MNLNWNEYIFHLLNSDNEYNNIKISINDGHTMSEIPPLIRASISILDKMQEHMGPHNLLVFPDRSQSFFIFTVMMLYHSISQGKICCKYDPENFTPGDKLKVGNVIAKYLGTDEIDGKHFLRLQLAESIVYSAPISNLPIFQKVTTNRCVSNIKSFKKAVGKALADTKIEISISQELAHAAEMKTHLDKSIFYMTSLVSASDFLSNCQINGKKLSDIFYIGKADFNGNINNLSAGQMTGIPALVIASDLYTINEAIKTGNPVQSVIIDGSNNTVLTNQLNVLDELIKLHIPITVINDATNSFELESYIKSGFNVWRWNAQTLTQIFYESIQLSLDKKIRNCAQQMVEYLKTDEEYISSAMSILSSYRRKAENFLAPMMKLFEMLNYLTFNALRAIAPLTNPELDTASHMLCECSKILNSEFAFIDKSAVSDFDSVIKYLKHIYISEYSFQKEQLLKEYLIKYSNYSESKEIQCAYLIIPDGGNKQHIQHYWNSWCRNYNPSLQLIVLNPTEYYALADSNVILTIVCGWLKRAIMRKIIYSYNTHNYLVLLYDYENHWKEYALNQWNKGLSVSTNADIITRALSHCGINISSTFFDTQLCEESPSESDELGEIASVLQRNKYRKYIVSNKSDIDTVQAIPVNFVGGFLSLYRTTHKVVSATKIIMEDFNATEMKLPNELEIGDFVLELESDKDLIRVIADRILMNSGKERLRKTSALWHDALQIEMSISHCSNEEFCKKMHAVGCTKSDAAINNWINNEDVISPFDKDDLQYLAAVTNNETLSEKLDEIYDAAKEVRAAHTSAGRKLSELLRKIIVGKLKEENVDPFNNWEPIDMDIDGIGNVKILKIIDKGSVITVDVSNTNRLISDKEN